MEEENTVLRSGPLIDTTAIFLVVFTILVFLFPLFVLFPPIPPSQRDALLETHSPIGLGQKKLKGNDARKSPTTKTKAKATITDLWIYPIKSCKGIQVTESKVFPSGLEFDRLYTFAQLKSPFPVGVDSPDDEKSAHKWEFITQRQFPLLATVHVDLYVPDVDKARGRPLDLKVSDSFLLVRFPWQERGLLGVLSWVAAKIARGRHAVPEKEVILPVAFPSQGEIETQGYSHEQVTIWRDTVTALNMEADLPRELRLYLGVSNRLGLFRIDPARLRQVFRCAPTQEQAGYQPVTGFQDAYPLHLLNLSSVRDFGAKIDNDDFRDLDPRRFRANIIVDGGDLAPYEEETWRKVRFTGGKHPRSSTFHVSCRTVRCKMPNVDQDNGHKHPVEPDRSLRKFRDVDEGAKNKGCLGMQLTPLFDKTTGPAEEMESSIEVGMSVEVLETGEHLYIKQ